MLISLFGMDQIDVNILKEPRGFIRVLQFVCHILNSESSCLLFHLNVLFLYNMTGVRNMCVRNNNKFWK